MVGSVEFLRRNSPAVYKAAMRGKLLLHDLRMARRREHTGRLMRDRDTCVEVAGAVGLGGILSLAGNALLLGERVGRPVALRLSSPLYMPTNRVDDWLDTYFDRAGRRYDPSFLRVEIAQVPRLQDAGFSETAEALWDYMSIKPEIISNLDRYPRSSLLGIHFRGSDKFLEAQRVAVQQIFAAVDEELMARRFDAVFVASDEPEFIELALSRYGERAFALPQEAVAKDDRPAHFADQPGEVKAREAIETMVMLSRSSVCVRTPSSLSDWASTLAAPDARFRLVQ